MIRTALFGTILVISLVIGAFVTIVGPWPAYGYKNFEGRSYYRTAVQAIERDAQRDH